MPWADVDEFTDFLTAAGLLSDPPTAIQHLLDLEGALGAATDAWDEETHYWPFLSNGDVNEVRKFSPELGAILDLNGGLLTLTSLSTSVQYTNGASDGGVVRTASTDFWLRPSDAPQRKKPWTYIQAGRTGLVSGWPDSVVITGEWGYCTDANLPGDARRAHMAMAAQELMPQMTMLLRRGGLTMLQEGDSKKQWGDKLQEMAGFWGATIESALKRYRRARMA